MKFKIILVSLFLCLWVFPVQAQDSWEIREVKTELDVNKYAELTVTETIDTYFHEEKSGIIRDIPYVYEDENGDQTKIGIEVLDVYNDLGSEWEYLVTDESGYKRIRIGDPEVYLTGSQVYNIKYKATGAVRYFDDHDEIYWDVSGFDWEVPVQSSRAIVNTPFVQQDQIQTRCYTGLYGSSEMNCLINQNGGVINFSADDYLTVVVGFPKGMIMQPVSVDDVISVDRPLTEWRRMMEFAHNSYGYVLPLEALLIMYILWRSKGRDPENRPGTVVQYESPDNTTPAEMGFLYYQKFKTSFLPAELVLLAHKGFIKIKELKKKKYQLIKRQGKPGNSLSGHEKILFDKLFEKKDQIDVDKLPNDFYQTTGKIKKQIFAQLKEREYYDKNPQAIKYKYITLAILIFMGSFVVAGLGTHVFLGGVVSAIIIFVFAYFMPYRLPDGAVAFEHAQGFKKYLSAAESSRVKWEEKQNLFFEFLPYAMVFGIARKWAKAFQNVFQEPPEWYEGAQKDFSVLVLADSMQAMSSSAVVGMSPIRSSSSSRSSGRSSGFSSGGFSGGGFGGGGGSSW